MFCILLAAYPLSKTSKQFPKRSIFMWILVFCMLFNGGTVPWYITMKGYGLVDSIWGLVLGMGLNVYNLILAVNFFKNLPAELEEAALIDGAGHWRILWGLYVPCSLPAIATLTLFFVVGHWNEWFSAQIYLNRTEQYPLQSYLQVLLTQSKNTQNLSLKELEELAKVNNRTFNSAQIVLSTLPVLLVYPFLQRYFVTGLTLGSVKG